jgi:REP element-mobilizing transposase RayT
MAHTYTNLLVHVIFSTKDRTPMIDDAIRDELHRYLGGAVRELGAKALIVGGTRDHVHMLLRLPADLSVAECVRKIKASSSGWVHRKWPERRSFAWQEGYSAFSVSESQAKNVVAYIAGQEQHHARVPFADEFAEFCRKNGIEIT